MNINTDFMPTWNLSSLDDYFQDACHYNSIKKRVLEGGLRRLPQEDRLFGLFTFSIMPFDFLQSYRLRNKRFYGLHENNLAESGRIWQNLAESGNNNLKSWSLDNILSQPSFVQNSAYINCGMACSQILSKLQ